MQTNITLTPNNQTRKRPLESPQSNTSAKKTVMEAEDLNIKVGDLPYSELMKNLTSNFKKLLEGSLTEVAKREDLRAIEDRLKGVEENNTAIRKEIERLEGSENETWTKLETLEKRLEDLNNRSRRNNLVIKNLPGAVKSGTQCAKVVTDFFKQALGLDVRVNRAHSVGRPEDKLTIVHIPFDNEIEAILSNTRELAGSNIYINRDFSPRVRAVRGKLLKLRKCLKEAGVSDKISLVYDHLYVGSVRIDWNVKDGLVCGKTSALENLRKLKSTVDWKKLNQELLQHRTSADSGSN